MGQGGLPRLISRADNYNKIEEELESFTKNYTGESDEAATVELLHAACKVRILSLAEKLAVSKVPNSIILVEEPVDVEIPLKDSWGDFKVGDWVRIHYSLSDFRNIQLRTLGWNPRLSTIHSLDSVVTKRWSSFENGVKIYTPTALAASVVYAGLLEKIPDSERQKDKEFLSRWKVNDYVMIASESDDRALQILQRGLDTIPERLIMRRGRVIAVTKMAIVVTFNERTSYVVKSSVLTKCQDQVTPLYIPQRHHRKGFRVGDECMVKSDIRKLIQNQSGHGGWSGFMTKLAGKLVTIIHIKKNGNVMVQYKQGNSYMINPKSLVSLGPRDNEDDDDDTVDDDTDDENTTDDDDDDDERLLKRGDIVKVSLNEDTRDAIRKTKVPSAFLEYLRITAEVRLIDDDFNYLIRYNNDQIVNVNASALEKATMAEDENHYNVKSMVKNITIGSSVFLNVGPPSYVKAVLRDFDVPVDVVRALTRPSKLMGYEHGGKAVIKYDDGLQYKVKKKYLTVPEKFNMQRSRNGPTLGVIKLMKKNIKTTVSQSDYNSADDTSVKIISMCFEGPPFIDFRVYSNNKTDIDEIATNLIDLDLEVEQVFDNWFYVSDASLFEKEIKISIFFNDEPYLRDFTEFETPNSCEEITHSRKRMIRGPIRDDVQPHGPRPKVRMLMMD